LISLGTLVIDVVKVKANVSKHKATRYGRMHKEEARLSKEVDELCGQAQAVDQGKCMKNRAVAGFEEQKAALDEN
jgi:hypothetical protein